MKVMGIIAEYNPLHEGHVYQLKRAKEVYGADAVMIVMSGDFTQRGAPALYDKYERARLAVENGADLIFMLPELWSTASAEGFATAGVKALIKTGICDSLLFGSENDDIDAFTEVAKILLSETPLFQETLKEALKSGLSFPLARERAIRKIIDTKDFFLSSPNNILGLEYVKALLQEGSSIEPIAMKRVGADYHDASLPNDCGQFVSASAIRNVVKSCEGTDPDADAERIAGKLSEHLSEGLLQPLLDAIRNRELIDRDDASLLLHEALLRTDDYTIFADCSEQLSNRIKNVRNEFLQWSALNDRLKTRELTYSRISRVLLHILLGFTDEDYRSARALDLIPYLRVLTFNKTGEALLSKIAKKSDLPLIVNPKEAEQQLSGEAFRLFEKDIFAADLYRAIRTNRSGRVYPNEYSRKFERIN